MGFGDFSLIKVLQFCNTLAESDGGPARYSLDLHHALRRAGVHARLVSIRPRMPNSLAEPLPGDAESSSVRFFRMTPSGKASIGIVELLRQVRESDAIIIDGYYLPWIPPLTLISRALGTPIYLAPHGSLTLHQRNTSRIKKWLFTLISRWAVDRQVRRFIVMSQREGDELLIGIPHARVEVTGAGTTIPLSGYADGPCHSPVRLLSLSRIARKKRIDLMIAAVGELSDAGTAVKLVIAGSGDIQLERELKAQARVLELEDKIDFVGMISGEGKRECLKSSDIFLLPSDDENFGIGLAEAMSHGLLSIVSAQVDASALMSTSAGIIIADPTAPMIAEAIRELANSSDFAERRKSARSEAVDAFGWDAIGRTWTDMFIRTK
ncbi:glycosyltransferase family 4 protein [Glaciibacter sp. 2TAF33]|uniref:glycosyltransferase family 4 protein n=1 Tax=Glaciibacter sp. 2TAF33 TaxID=3233015 RepID=UPI003F8E946F